MLHLGCRWVLGRIRFFTTETAAGKPWKYYFWLKSISKDWGPLGKMRRRKKLLEVLYDLGDYLQVNVDKD